VRGRSDSDGLLSTAYPRAAGTRRYSINYRRLAVAFPLQVPLDWVRASGGATGVLTWLAIFLAAEPRNPLRNGIEGLCY
jgi:hypothetical protein